MRKYIKYEEKYIESVRRGLRSVDISTTACIGYLDCMYEAGMINGQEHTSLSDELVQKFSTLSKEQKINI